jgi:hypothetical protein
MKELVLYASEKRGNALIAETSKSHLLAFPHGHELTQNVMLFPLCFGLLFRTPRLKKLAQSTDHQPKTAEQPDAEQPDWVELIGATVTRIPEFSYGTIARPIRP